MSNLYDSNYRVIFIPVVILICQHKCAILVTQPLFPPLCNSLGSFSKLWYQSFQETFCKLQTSPKPHCTFNREGRNPRENTFSVTSIKNSLLWVNRGKWYRASSQRNVLMSPWNLWFCSLVLTGSDAPHSRSVFRQTPRIIAERREYVLGPRPLVAFCLHWNSEDFEMVQKELALSGLCLCQFWKFLKQIYSAQRAYSAEDFWSLDSLLFASV